MCCGLRDITDDEAFVDELRVTLRFFAAVLVRRTQKVISQNIWGHIRLSLHSSISVSGGCGVPHHKKAS